MKITDEEVEQICSKVDCPSIKEITLNNPLLVPNAISHHGVLHILRMKQDNLIQLSLSQDYFIQSTIAALKAAPDLFNNTIGDKGCKYLTRAHMPNLEKMHLWGNSINDAGLLHLYKEKWLKLTISNVSCSWGGRRDRIRVEAYYYVVRSHFKNLINLPMGQQC